jgi:hypothetical protein
MGPYTHLLSVNSLRTDRDTPYDCCFFDLEKDPGENYPKEVNCSKQHEIANTLYDNKQICQEFPTICISNVTNEQPSSADVYSIWSHYGASGPFTNKDGIPIGQDLGMKCVCDGFYRDVVSMSQINIKSFLPSVFSPYLCSDKSAPEDGIIYRVNCTGGFARVPQVRFPFTLCLLGPGIYLIILHSPYQPFLSGGPFGIVYCPRHRSS